MKTTYLPFGITVLLALSACSGEKEASSAALGPAVPVPVESQATPGKVTPPQTRDTEPIHRSVKKKTPKPTVPSTETIKKPEEIISTRTIVS